MTILKPKCLLLLTTGILFPGTLPRLSAQGPAPTSTSLVSSANPSVLGQPVMLSATVTGAASGRVTFYAGASVLGTGSLDGNSTSITTLFLPPGTNSLSAYYGGAPGFAPSKSPPVSQVVNSAGSGLLSPPQPVSIGIVNQPVAIAIADFNRDGLPDVAEADAGLNLVNVFFGAGGGAVTSSFSITVGNSPRALVAGDFNRDGIPDIAVVNAGNNNLYILIGLPGGGFTVPLTCPGPGCPDTGAGPTSLVASDFDGDGITDLAVGNGAGVRVLFGAGDGTFTATTDIPLGSSVLASALIAGDFNSDGLIDLAVGGSAVVNVAISQGSRAFALLSCPGAGCPAAGAQNDALAVGDFNNDGTLDLVAVDSYVTGNNLIVSLGVGDGTFLPAVAACPGAGCPSAGVNPKAVAVWDFNGDGILDLVVANAAANSLTVFLGVGGGIFVPVNTSSVGNEPSALITEDFNQDGRADVIVANSLSSQVSVLLGGQAQTETALNAGLLTLGSGNFGALTARVTDLDAGAFNAPTGTVTFSDGQTTLGSGELTQAASGFATATFLGYTPSDGVHSVTAQYSGDSGNAPSSSPVSTVTVGNALTGTSVSMTVNSFLQDHATVAFGQPFTVVVSINSYLIENVSEGSVILSEGGSLLGSAVVVNSFASFPNITVPVGVHQLVAAYSGTATFNPSSGSISIVAVVNGSVTGLISSINPSSPGIPISFTATVTDPSGLNLPSGLVTLSDGGAVLATQQLDQFGRAIFSAGGFAGGPHKIVATYHGMSGVLGGSQAQLVEVIGSDSITALSVSPATALVGQPITLTGQVSPTPTLGRVAFYDGANLLGTGVVTGGTATLVTSLVSAGTHSFSARYLGDSTSGSSRSLPVTATISSLLGFGLGEPATAYPMGSLSSALAIADFNEDGRPDVAVSNYITSDISVLISNASEFQPTVSLPYGGSVFGVSTGDFNGDGHTDIIATGPHGAAGGLVFLGNGDGTFRPGLPLPSSERYNSYKFSFAGDPVVVSDFNLDGKADLAFSSGSAAGTAVLLGNGDGTFQPEADYVGLIDVALITGDFNGNGIPDLAGGSLSDGAIHVLAGNGDGTFAEGSSTPSSTSIYSSLVVADFNGDGIDDILVRDLTNILSVYLGDGSGSFQQPQELTISGQPLSATVADFNGDGVPDLGLFVRADNSSANLFEVVLATGNGDGTFQIYATTSPLFPSTTYYAPLGVIASADFNKDGRSDIAVAGQIDSSTQTQSLRILLNSPTPLGGQFTATTTTLASSANPSAYGERIGLTATIAPPAATGKVVFYQGSKIVGTASVTSGAATLNTGSLPAGTLSLSADFKGNSLYLPSTAGTVSQTVVPQQTSGIAPAVSVATGNGPDSIAAADFNGDGSPDLVIANSLSNSLSILTGRGDGTFNINEGPATGTQPTSVITGDFNGDGLVDLAVSNFTDNTLSIFIGNGSGTFVAQSITYPVPSPDSVAAGDLNRDGILDLVASSRGPGSFSVLIGNGDGTFQSPVSFGEEQSSKFLTIEDVTGDTIPDVVYSNSEGTTVSVFPGNGNGTFQVPFSSDAGSSPAGFVVGDFNADGRPDIAVANTGLNQVTVLLGTGAGLFQPATYAAGTQPSSIAAIDYNADGVMDLAVANAGSNNVSILLGNSDGSFQSATSFGVGTGPRAIVAASFRSDGLIDLATANFGSNDASVLLGIGLTIQSHPPLAAAAVGNAYSSIFTAAGGVPPYSWSAAGDPGAAPRTGSVPPGFTISSVNSTGVLSGSASTLGDYAFILTVRDSTGHTAIQNVSLAEVQPNVAISNIPAVLPPAFVGKPYRFQFSASANVPGTFSWAAASVPPGLVLDSRGLLSGIPTTLSNAAFDVIAYLTPGPLDPLTGDPFPNGSAPSSRIVSFTQRETLSISASETVQISPSALSFTAGIGLPTPLPQAVTIATGGDHVGYTVSTSGQAWLQVTPLNGTTPGAIQVGIDPTDLTPATYTSSLTVTFNGGVADSRTLQVTLVVPQPGDIAIPDGDFSFASVPAGKPSSQNFTLTSSNGNSLPFEISVDPGPAAAGSSSRSRLRAASSADSALQISPSTGATPALITLTLDPTLLTPGARYLHKVRFTFLGKSVDRNVTITTAPALAQLSVTPTILQTKLIQGQAVLLPLLIQNSGGVGDLSFHVAIQDAASTPWLNLIQTDGTVSGSSAGTVQVRVDTATLQPGYYLGKLRVALGTLAPADVPVSLTVRSAAPSMRLEFKGVTLRFRQGQGLSKSQTVRVFDQGTREFSWAAQVDPVGSQYITLKQEGTQSAPKAPGSFSISLRPEFGSSQTPPGLYYANVTVSSADAANSPQLFTVLIEVQDPAKVPASPLPEPSGLVFLASPDSEADPQNINVFTSNLTDVPFTAAPQIFSGPDRVAGNPVNWLFVSPVSGVTSTGQTGQVQVTVLSKGLTPGVYIGQVTLAIGESSQAVVVIMIVTSSPAVQRTGQQNLREAASPACTRASLVPFFVNGLPGNFTNIVGGGNPISVTVRDNCGQLVPNPAIPDDPAAQVVIRFSAGNPKGDSMDSHGDGTYDFTWVPDQPDLQANVQVMATLNCPEGGGSTSNCNSGSANFVYAGTADVTGSNAASTAPAIGDYGIVSAFSRVSAGALAPGSIVEIYGQNLFGVGNYSASKVPVPTAADKTKVFIGGIEAPIYYAAANQINALVPTELVPGGPYPVQITVGQAFTVAKDIEVDPVSPAIAACDGQGGCAAGTLIAQHALDYKLVTAANPAKPGETIILYLVGMGQTDSTIASGNPPPADHVALTSVPATVALDGVVKADLPGFLVPGAVGLYQVNFIVPADTSPGNHTLSVRQGKPESNPAVFPVAAP